MSNIFSRRKVSSDTYPIWFKAPMILFGLCLLVVVMNHGKFILVPLAFAALFSSLLNPLVKLFESWKLGRAPSIIVALFLVMVVLAGILTLITAQFIEFAERVPEITERLKNTTERGVEYLESTVGISQAEQTNYINDGLAKLIDTSGSFFGTLASATTGMITFISLLPIFSFFMIYYREMYRTFFLKVFDDSSDSEVDDVIKRVQEVIQNYLIGLITVMGILALLNTAGLFIIGLEYAIFFGVFAAFLAIIPYIGIIMGALPPLLFAFLLGDSLLLPVLVIAVFAVVQFLEGNFISPNIIGSKVSINPFVAIIALIIGGGIWGIAGMILFVPLVGVLRVVFYQIEELKPYSYLLGNAIEYKE